MLADITCDGCLAIQGRLCGYCRHCKIRPCAVARGVVNCAHCEAYACDELERLLRVCDEQHGLFAYARKARATLDEIRAGLSV